MLAVFLSGAPYRSSVASVEQVISEHFDFALLDIELTNGQSYDIAKELHGRHVPFAFVSGNAEDEPPDELRRVPFIRKPFGVDQIEQGILVAAARCKNPPEGL